MKRWIYALMTALFAAICLAAVGCKPKVDGPVEKEEGPETGVYYYDANSEEYLISLRGGDECVFLVKDRNETGTYALEGEVLTLTLGEDEIKGRLSEDVMTLEIDGSSMRFLKKINYTVSYETNGGSAVSAETVVNGKTVKKPSDPTKAGNRFLGWYKEADFSTLFGFESEPITSSITLYARWMELGDVKNESRIDYDLNYPGAENPESTETVGGKILELPKAERAGYEFGGWWISMAEEGDKLTYAYEDGMVFEEDTILFALWKEPASGSKLSTPLVSVRESGLSWNGDERANTYRVVITGPDGFPGINKLEAGTSLAVDFASYPAGDYEIRVTAEASSLGNNSETAVRYYRNKALGRVKGFKVVEPCALVFEAVEHAQKYLIEVECGNPEHRHNPFDNGNSTYFSFENCEMKPGGIVFRVTAEAEGYASTESREFVYNRELAKIEGLQIDGETETVSWDAVPGAAYYDIKVEYGTDGTYEGSISGSRTSFCLKEFSGRSGGIVVEVRPRTRGYNSPEWSREVYQKTRLASPAGVRIEGETLIWEEVPGATSYSVRIGSQILSANGTSFELKDLSGITFERGEDYRLSVRANGSENSLWSDDLDARYYAMSQSLVYSAGEVSWKYVIGAEHYEVRVNGGQPVIVEGTNRMRIKLTQAGENEISVRYYENGNTSEWASTTVFAYTMTFDTRQGSGLEPYYYAAGDRLELPEAGSTERAGYDFAGWYNVPNGPKSNGAPYSYEFYTEVGDVVVYAYWTNAHYDVTLNYENGSDGTGSGQVTFDEHFTLEVPENEDGTIAFAGWFTAPNGLGTQVTDERGRSVAPWQFGEGLPLYARWVNVFTFEKLTDGTYSVSKGPGIEYVSSVVIPEKYDNVLISVVEGYAFIGCTTLKSVTVHDTIQTIESTAFYGCYFLEEILVEHVSTVKEPVYSSVDGVLIETNRLDHKKTLAYFPAAKSGEYIIPDGVEVIPVQMFANSKLTKVTIPKSVIRIEQNAFNGSSRLKDVIFEEGGTSPISISEYAFNGCTLIESITLPARLSQFSVDIFSGCTKLAYVHMEPYGTTYASDDGVLTNADGTELIYCPAGRSGEFEIPARITKILASAFASCNKLSKVIISAAVQEIGENAFLGCRFLNSVVFSSGSVKELSVGKEAFRDCISLATVVFEEGSRVAVLSEGAFKGCTNLQTITIPSSMKEIKDYAFDGCSGLMSVDFEEDGESLVIGNYVFQNCVGLREVTIPANVTEINTNVFAGCDNIRNIYVEEENGYYRDKDGVLFDHDFTTILFYPKGRTGAYVIPETVTSIEEGVFSGNKKLPEITIGESIVNVGARAFKDCTALHTVTISEEGEQLTLGESLFDGCTSLTTLHFPNRVKTIPAKLLANCASITHVTFSDEIQEIGDGAFQGTSISEIVLPSKLTKIGNEAFRDSKIQSVTISGSVQSVGYNIFFGCTELTTVVLEEGVPSIPFQAFSGCTKLEKIEIPASVTELGAYAFNNCSALVSVTFAPGEDTLKVGLDNRGSMYGRVFANCTALESFVYPKRADCLPTQMFFTCRSLQKFSFEEGSKIQSIGTNVFNMCSSLSEFEFPEGIEKIESNAFGNCYALQTITIPKTVKNTQEESYYGPSTAPGIGSSAFTGSGLVTVIFESGSDDPLSLGDYCFQNCASLKEITLPKRLEGYESGSTYHSAIGSRTFDGCTSLTEFKAESGGSLGVEDGILTSDNGKKILCCPAGKTGSVTIKKEVTFIDYRAFAGCINLTEVTFEEGGQEELLISPTAGGGSYNGYAFSGSSITSITLPERTVEVGISAFAECLNLKEVHLPASLKTIGNSAFSPGYYDESALQTVTFAEGSKLERIGDYAFQNCAKLTTLNIPSSVVYIGKSAFSSCAGIRTLTFLEGGENEGKDLTILSGAFEKTQISEVKLPKRLPEPVTTYGSYLGLQNNVFSGCKNLSKVTFTNGFNVSAFTGCPLSDIVAEEDSANYKTVDGILYDKLGTTLILYPSNRTGESYTTKGVQKIGSYAFSNLVYLKYITIGKDISSVGERAFMSSESLVSITFEADGASAVEIGTYAFSGSSVETVTLPDKLSKLDENAFSSCKSLKTVNFGANSTLSEIGNYCFQNCSSLTAIVIPASVVRLGTSCFMNCESLASVSFLGEGITAFPSTLFSKCLSLTRIEIPRGVTSLGGSCFEGSGLEFVTIPDSVSAISDSCFSSCQKLTDVSLPEHLTSIGYNSFYNCSALEQIDIPQSVTTISSRAFSNCTLLNNVELPSGATVSDGVFNECSSLTQITLPAYMPMIPSSFFANCTSLESIEIPKTVTSINSSAFQYCESLHEIEFPESVITISMNAFQGCVGLEELLIPENIRTVDSYAFSGCTNLRRVTILIGLLKLGDYAFENCVKIRDFNLPGTVNTLGVNPFSGCENLEDLTVELSSASFVMEDGVLFSADKTELILYPAGKTGSYTIGDEVQSIASGAFAGSKIESVKFGEKITAIPENCFSGCKQLMHIVLPEALTDIGAYAFYQSGITELNIGSNVKTIGARAFSECLSLRKVEFSNDPSPYTLTFKNDTFGGCTSLISVTLPARLRTMEQYNSCMGSGTFRDCKALTSVTFGKEDPSMELPNALTMGGYTFQNCVSLEEIVFPAYYHDFMFAGTWGPSVVKACSSFEFDGCTSLKSVKFEAPEEFDVSLGGYMFNGCSSLKDITIPNAETMGGYYGNTFTGTAIEEITIPAKMLELGEACFAQCTSLRKVTFEGTLVTSIEANAFEGCTSLQEIDLGKMTAIKRIDTCAFKDCSSLEKVVLPEGMQSIMQEAFANCTKVEDLFIPAGITVGKQAFSGWTKDQTIRFACSSTESAQWTDWQDGCEAQILWDQTREN